MNSREFEKAEAKENSKDSKNDNKDSFEKMFFPPEIFRFYKNTKIFSQWNKSDFKIQSVKEFNDLIAETKKLVNTQRAYLKKHHLPKKESLFWKEMNDVKNIAYWNKNDVYSDVDENGFHYIEVGGYIIRLKIVKINNEPKIINIFLLAD